MRETIVNIRDDLTNEVIPDDRVVTVPYMFGDDVSGTFEGTQQSVDALTLLFAKRDVSLLADLLMPVVEARQAEAAKATQSRPRGSGRKHGSGDHAKAREWCQTAEGQEAVKRLGIQPTDIGRMPAKLVEAYQEYAAKAA